MTLHVLDCFLGYAQFFGEVNVLPEELLDLILIFIAKLVEVDEAFLENHQHLYELPNIWVGFKDQDRR